MIELVTRFLRLTRRQSQDAQLSPLLGLPLPAVDTEEVIDMCEVSCLVPATGGRSAVIVCSVSGPTRQPEVITNPDGSVTVEI